MANKLKYFELAVLYLIAPLLAFVLVHSYKIPLIIILLPMFFVFLFILMFDGTFNWKQFWLKGFDIWETTRIIGLFMILGPVMAMFAYHFEPERFLLFAKSQPKIWLLIMVLYPLISVTTQEIMYRVLFFHRYAPLFSLPPWQTITLNAALFAYCHLIFQNWPAIAISFIGGLIFSYTYYHTRSFWAVCAEHSLYGCLIFTLGLGRYFFTGVSNVTF